MFKTIIASGGGIKLLTLIGGLIALKEENLFSDFKNYIGVSAGSLVLLLLLLDYKINEIFFNCLNTPQLIVNDENSILNIIQENGISSGIELINYIDNLIENKLNKRDISFKELHDSTGKILVLGITNLASQKIEYMSYKNFPNFKVSDAIRLSCSLPLLFTSAHYYKIIITNNFNSEYYYLSSIYKNYFGFYQNDKKLIITKNKEYLTKIHGMIYYLEKKWIFYCFSDIYFKDEIINNKSIIIKKKSKILINNFSIKFLSISTYADGGIVDNFPIQLSQKFTGEAIGFTYQSPKDNKEYIIDNIFVYLDKMKDCCLHNLISKKMRKFKDIYLSVKLPNKLSTFTLNISNYEKKKLLLCGYNQTKEFIKNKCFPTNYKNKSLILIEIDKLDNLDKISKLDFRTIFKDQPIGIFSDHNLITDNINKLKLDRIFYYIISEGGGLIIRNKEAKHYKLKLLNNQELYDCLINDILYYLSKCKREIINTDFIIQSKNTLEIYPHGKINDEDKIIIDRKLLSKLKKKIDQKYWNEIKTSIDKTNFKLIIINKNDNKFQFLNNLLDTHLSITIYTNNLKRINKNKLPDSYTNKIFFKNINRILDYEN